MKNKKNFTWDLFKVKTRYFNPFVWCVKLVLSVKILVKISRDSPQKCRWSKVQNPVMTWTMKFWLVDDGIFIMAYESK